MTPAPTRLVDFAFELARAYATSPTLATSYDADVGTATEPSAQGKTNGVFDLTKYHSGAAPRYVHVFPFGDANNATFSLRLVAWRKSGSMWMPYTLFEGDCIAGNFAGVAGNADWSGSEFMADQIAGVTGNANVDYEIVSPSNDTPAHVLVDLKGCQKLKFALKKGTATVANALFAVL